MTYCIMLKLVIQWIIKKRRFRVFLEKEIQYSGRSTSFLSQLCLANNNQSAVPEDNFFLWKYFLFRRTSQVQISNPGEQTKLSPGSEDCQQRVRGVSQRKGKEGGHCRPLQEHSELHRKSPQASWTSAHRGGLCDGSEFLPGPGEATRKPRELCWSDRGRKRQDLRHDRAIHNDLLL